MMDRRPRHNCSGLDTARNADYRFELIDDVTVAYWPDEPEMGKARKWKPHHQIIIKQQRDASLSQNEPYFLRFLLPNSSQSDPKSQIK